MGVTSDVKSDEKGNVTSFNMDKGHYKFKSKYMLKDFEKEKTLGKGHFGEVNSVKLKKNQKYYAMKKLISKNNNDDQIKEEIKLLENLNHPHIINYYTSFKEENSWYIVVEYMNGQNLQDLINNNIKQKKYLEAKKVFELLIQCLSGLLYLHKEKKIIHRDIKPDNLLLDEDFNLKISDFGVSAKIDNNMSQNSKNYIGPKRFSAPEVFDGNIYEFNNDIYSLGLTFILLMTNKININRKEFTNDTTNNLNTTNITNSNNSNSTNPANTTNDSITINIINTTPNTNNKIYKTCIDEELPNIYPDDLKQLILSFLQNIYERPNSEKAFCEALHIYIFKYLKVTSIMALYLCLFNIIKNIDYFEDNNIINDMKNNENNKYIFTKISFDILQYYYTSNFSKKDLEKKCKELRFLYDKEKYDINKSIEIDLFDFILFILKKLNEEIKQFDEDNNMIINNNFFYSKNLVYQCKECNNVINEIPTLECICVLYPGKTNDYFKKFDININDLFKHFSMRRKYDNTKEKVFCKNCQKEPNRVYKTNIFYTLPPNLIIKLEYNDAKKFNLIIEENIDIKEFVQRDDICQTKYKLIGVIFYDYNDNKEEVYKSISKNEDNKWVLFNGKSIEFSDFNNIQQNKNLKYLFYTNL